MCQSGQIAYMKIAGFFIFHKVKARSYRICVKKRLKTPAILTSNVILPVLTEFAFHLYR